MVYPTQRWYYFCAPDEYLENDKSISVNSYELQGLPLDLCDNPTVVSTDNQFGKKKKIYNHWRDEPRGTSVRRYLV